MTDTRARSVTLVVLGLLVLASVTMAAPAAAASSSPAPSAGAVDTVAVESIETDVAMQTNETNNTTATTNPDRPSLAERSRIAPVDIGAEYASITAKQEADGYNVVGEFAIFSVTEEVEAARIQQPGAEVRVLDGGQTIQVDFAEDAAPPDGESLFTIKLFYTDGSERSVSLYASDTNQIVASAELQEMSTFLRSVRSDAEANGYETTTEGIRAYYEDTKEQAEIFSNLLGPELAAFFAVIVTASQSSLFIAFVGVVIILTARYIYTTHGHKIRAKKNAGNAAKDKREKYQRFYEEQREAAAEEPLSSIDEIGGRDILWNDRFGVSTVKQLADLAAVGDPQRDESGNIIMADPETDDVDPLTDANGDVLTDKNGDPIGPPKLRHHGVSDLVDAEALTSTWLEPILRSGYLTEDEALVHLKYVLKRMSAHYGQREYDDALGQIQQLISDRNSGTDITYAESDRGSGYSGGTATGGDD
ncbi:hypothetical protein [Halorubrum sp. CSM-61]|uniref:hypothetical protein n=1 Tax=Halorubrum sp. CSM-61 TaxID=2485838 RepID=UPI000F4C1AAE|nr:hypothetical protein [Halorubrum sp. CSM-61]